MIIRQETPEDYSAVEQLLNAAFESPTKESGESLLVQALRKNPAYLPELSLVAILGDRIVGYILFSPVTIGGHSALALAPLAVLPAYQKRGIGSKLIAAGHAAAQALGSTVSVVLGSHEYYPKFGYLPAASMGILSPFDVPDKNFMALRLQQKEDIPQGTVEYPKEFSMVD